MELPILTISNILNDSIPEIDWYVNNVPKEKVGLPNLPLGRIVELSGTYEGFASNDPTALFTHLQVDVWVKDMKELSKYYYKIDEVLRDEAIQCTYTEQTHDIDFENTRRIIKRYTITQRVR